MTLVTIQDVLRVTGLPSEADGGPIKDADIAAHIAAGEALVERYLGTSLQQGGTSRTDVLDGNGQNTLYLPRFPILSVTSLSVNGTTVQPTDLYVYANTGKIVLKPTASVQRFPTNPLQAVTIEYKYGRTAQRTEREFIALTTAVSVLMAQIGGTFDDVTTYNIPELGTSKGEPYTNIREALDRLTRQLESYKTLLRPNPVIA